MNKFVIFQHGYSIIGEGAELFLALEDALGWSDELPKYEDLECFDCVQSPVDGNVYWTSNPETIADI